ncbi:hypothetical protein AJ80_06151 [Polytolypa hystricis UAMH7299]|uniref:Uncharacterized protein n=1 Tax=Polytolypa hystricis (strain UAMH7299) TaxID=1447883 RepID=A0A2B7XZ27_POLH7|nr:hypothetical protein AJ80_06151 [Polytolypa hystricis UAMH7299]
MCFTDSTGSRHNLPHRRKPSIFYGSSFSFSTTSISDDDDDSSSHAPRLAFLSYDSYDKKPRFMQPPADDRAMRMRNGIGVLGSVGTDEEAGRRRVSLPDFEWKKESGGEGKLGGGWVGAEGKENKPVDEDGKKGVEEEKI